MPKKSNHASVIGSGVIEITRTYEGIKFIESTLPKNVEEKILGAFLLVGSPSKQFMFYRQIEDLYVYQFFNGTSSRSLVGVVVATNLDTGYTRAFHQAALEIHKRIGVEWNETIETINSREYLRYLSRIANLEGLLYALYTKKPVVIIGDEPTIRKIIIALNSILLPELVNNYSFISQTDQKLDAIDIQGVDPTIVSSFDLLDSHTVVNLSENRVYSLFDCPITINLAKLIQTENYEELTTCLAKLNNSVQKIRRLTEPTEVADSLQCSMADAEFLAGINQRIRERINQTNGKKG